MDVYLYAVYICIYFFWGFKGDFPFCSSFSLFFSFLEFIVSLSLRKCRYVGNIHTQVSEPLLQEVFASTGPVEGCKLVRKEKVYSSLCYLVNFWIVPVKLKICMEKLLDFSHVSLAFYPLLCWFIIILTSPLILLGAVILWIHPLLWSQICCIGYIVSKRKASVRRTLDFYLCYMLGFVSVAHFVICRFGQPIKVNWAYASGQREDTSGWFL